MCRCHRRPIRRRPPNLSHNNPFEIGVLEVRAVSVRELRHFDGQFGFGEDRVLRAQFCAVAAVDAFDRVDEYLGNRLGAGIALRRRDRRRRTFRHTDKVFDARIGYDISHEEYPLRAHPFRRCIPETIQGRRLAP
jgi:hypothetical protein